MQKNATSPGEPIVSYFLRCLFCPRSSTPVGGSLVALQAHALQEHGVTHADLERTVLEGEYPTYTWRLPDGRLWLQATDWQAVVRQVVDLLSLTRQTFRSKQIERARELLETLL